VKPSDVQLLDRDAAGSEQQLRLAWALLVDDPEWPRDEIRSIDDAVDRHLAPERHDCEQVVGIATGEDDRTEVRGMVVVQCLADVQTGLLEYLAVARGSRHGGVGTALFRLARSAARTRGVRHLLVEYDYPRDASDEARQRWRWYDRLGVHRAAVEYFQPPYRPGDAWKAMALAYDTELDGPPRDWRAIADGVREIYRRVYGADVSTPFVRDLLGRMADSRQPQLVDAGGGVVWQAGNAG
jgi:GNAT superfamily N-acetyltransferase